MTDALRPVGELPLRQVPFKHGWLWIQRGFGLFRAAPLIWIALIFLWLLIAAIVSKLPWIGFMLVNLFYPVFFAGLMCGCRAIDDGEEMELVHLFAGFRRNAAGLVTIGGINLVAQIVIGATMGLIASDHMPDIQRSMSGTPSPEEVATAIAAALPALTFGALLSVPLMMGMWFAPPLLAFHDITPMAAIRLSFRGCVANLKPFLLFGLIVSALVMVLVPITWRLALIVIIPTLIAATYAGYRDIFG